MNIKLAELMGLGSASGITLTIVIEWQHIAEKAIETGILSLVGGVMGALGGYLVSLIIKKYFKPS